MSQYKSAIRSQSQQTSSDSSPYRAEACNLNELFPSWTVDDLQILLSESNGDVQLAATKITDGVVQPWSEISRKKDKKPLTTTHASKPSSSSRGDSRGARGGRGGRGGPGRGGAVSRGRPQKSTANGHPTHPEGHHLSTSTNGAPLATESSKTSATEASAKESHEQQNGTATFSWADVSSQPENATSISGTSSWGHPTEDANGNVATHAPAPRQAAKTPATSKLSWAQVARPQEKPTPATPSVATPVTQPTPPIAALTLEVQPESEQNSWEEPTTVEAPTWDDPKQSPTSDTWPSTEVSTETSKAEVQVAPAESHTDVLEPTPKPTEVVESKQEMPAAPAPAPVAAPSPNLPRQTLATPSPKLTVRPAVTSHRSSARYKIPDQPVTLPLSFSSVEKVGMQFGSLSVGGDSATETHQPEPETPPEPTPGPNPAPQTKVETVAPAPPPATAPAASTSLTSVFQHQQPQLPTAVSHSQQNQSQPLTTAQSNVTHHSLPTSVSQPIASSQTTSHAASSPLQTFSQQPPSAQQQPPLTHNIAQQQTQHQPPHHQSQHLPQLPQQLQQNQALHSFNQHGLPIHLEPSQQNQASVQQQPLQSPAHSTYFRGAEASTTTPYFHAPTPPVSQPQDGSYGSFGQLAAQGQHQQASHLGAFGNNDYGYNDTTRGFYDSYAQQQGFASRNPLAHDDVKGIPGGQQSATSALPPSAAQGPQSHSSQAPNQQPQPAGGQGPQQTYPPPVPYYFTHAYQTQYYGPPYSSGYVPQPYVKYPTSIFQPGPPGPGSGGNPGAKQPGGNVGVGVQPQANPYNQGLYQQAGYDDYQAHPHHTQHQHTHSLGLSQGGVGEYGKQLYGGAGQGGIQAFMGLGGQGAAGGAGPASNAGPRSPETPYKPYASKDVNVTRNVPGQQGQGQGPPQGQGQGPTGQGGAQSQGFYGGNRFGGGVGGSGAGGPQQGGPQGHLAYPQGVSEANFYGYQPRQQQGYWQ